MRWLALQHALLGRWQYSVSRHLKTLLVLLLQCLLLLQLQLLSLSVTDWWRDRRLRLCMQQRDGSRLQPEPLPSCCSISRKMLLLLCCCTASTALPGCSCWPLLQGHLAPLLRRCMAAGPCINTR